MIHPAEETGNRWKKWKEALASIFDGFRTGNIDIIRKKEEEEEEKLE